MRKGIKILVMSLMCFSESVFANSTNLNLILGSAFSRLSNQRYMSPVEGLINSYVTNESIKNRPFYGLGAEYNFDHLTSQSITLGLGLAFYYLGSRTISGIETPGINILSPPQDILSYTIQTKNITILLEPKFVYTNFRLEPYILGGFGYARNTLRKFNESTVLGSLAVPSDSPYPSYTQTKFAYEGGLGFQYNWGNLRNNHALIFHIEYRYLNLGQSRLGTASAQTTTQHITISNTSNIVDFGITYRL